MDDKKSAFDKLVAGLSSDDRKMMLNKINKTVAPSVTLVETEQNSANANITLKIKYNNESIFYKIFIWFKSIIEKKEAQKVYNEDIVARIARKVNRDHPGLVNHKIKYMDMVFYQYLVSLKEAADFFRPYFQYIKQTPGDFYVFLSSFVAPDVVESINRNADPFVIPFEEDPTNDKRNNLLHKLDDILNNMNGNAKVNLYDAISSVNWLQKFTQIPFIHFISQFTNITGDAYTSPYKNIQNDYDLLAALFSDIDPINNEILEAIFLYSKKNELDGNTNVQDKDIEQAIKLFLSKANSNLAKLQMFISGVPIIKIGKIINDDYDWAPGNTSGVEAWFPAFRVQWRKIIDVRWNDWIRERKKYLLASNLQSDFKLSEFPTLKYKPWERLWIRVPFSCELTGGYLSWFATEVFDDIMPVLNDVMMEGVFLRNENRTEYSEALNTFVQANKEMLEVLERISPDGDYGQVFEEFSTSKMRTLQVQKQIDSMMASTESAIHECISLFAKSCRTIDVVFNGFVAEKKDGLHDGLQNFTTIKGHQNREWRDKFYSIHGVIKKSIFYISELEPIDASTRAD